MARLIAPALLLLAALVALTLARQSFADTPGTATMPASSTQPAPSAESQRLAAVVQKLPELELPDEWYSTASLTPAAHFASIAATLHAKDPNALASSELSARFENHGHPFVHTVWRNMPLHCPKCNNAGADGTFTVVSIARNASVELTALEMHDVTTHGGAFPPEKLALLKKILDPA